jgi:ABC-2 type transport system permease protein
LAREFSAALAYRGSLAVWMFGVVATSYVSLAVWLAALGDKASIGSFSRSGLVQYYLSSAIVAMLTSAWAVYWVSESIRMGGLNQHLLKPWSFLHFHIINSVGEKVIKLTVLLPMFAVIALAFRNDWYWAMSWWQALLLPVTVLMGAAIALLINICVGLVSFWISEVSGMWALYFSLDALLSGRLIPLALFPAVWQRWLWLSPFRYTLSLPLELIVGQLDARQTLIGVGLQVAWLAAAYLLYRLLWRAGIRGYEAVGG